MAGVAILLASRQGPSFPPVERFVMSGWTEGGNRVRLNFYDGKFVSLRTRTSMACPGQRLPVQGNWVASDGLGGARFHGGPTFGARHPGVVRYLKRRTKLDYSLRGELIDGERKARGSITGKMVAGSMSCQGTVGFRARRIRSGARS